MPIPSSLSVGDNTFTASGGGIDLDAGTTYFFVWDSSSAPIGTQTRISHTESEGDTGAAGWSMADVYHFRDIGGSTWSAHATRSIQIAVKGYAKDETAPALASAWVDGTTLRLNYNERLDTGSTPATGDFTYSVDGGTTNTNPTGVAMSRGAVTLTLGTAVTAGQTVTVSYTAGTNPVQDTAGNDAANLTNRSVTNVTGVTKPTVSAVEIVSTPQVDTDSNGTPDTYGLNEKVKVGLTFSEAVDVTTSAGTPRLQVLFGGNNWAEYESGSGTTELTFAITVEEPHETTGVGVNGNTLELNGGAIASASSDAPANLVHTALSRNSNHKVDWQQSETTAPTFESAAVEGTALTVTFDEDLDSASRPTSSRFSVSVTPAGSTSPTTVNGTSAQVGITGDTVSVTLASAVAGGDTVTVSYAKGDASQPLKDTASPANEVADFSGQAVTNNTSVPTFSSAAVDGTALTVTFDEDLDSASTSRPASSRFSVSVTPAGSTSSTTVNGTSDQVTISDATVTVTLASAVARGDTVTVSYAKGGATQPLKGTDGDEVADFSGKAVTNNTPDPPAAPAAPTVAQGTQSGSLDVSWTAPSGTITDYDLRYYNGSADPSDGSDWIEAAGGLPDPGTATSATIKGLLASTAYRVQVRAATSGGEGPWSSSGSATTGTAPATNNAPRVLESTGGSGCQVKTGTSTPWKTVNAPAGTAIAVVLVTRGSETAEFPTSCTTPGNQQIPVFDEKDGEQLYITIDYTLPDNVRMSSGFPSVDQPAARPGPAGVRGRVWVRGFAAFQHTDLRIDMTATDPHGASVSTHVIFQVGTSPNSVGAPGFASAAEGRSFALNEAIDPFVLAAATGGDVTSAGGAALEPPYFYEVSGLPAGLVFDEETRTVSGTPTAAGSYTVTYTVEDADGVGADEGDAAVQTFTLTVGDAPAIELVRIVSAPTYDSDSDGKRDTYVRGDRILVDMEFNKPVTVAGTPRLRLDLGPDNADLVDGSRRTADMDKVLNGGRTLRFAYTVTAGDRDTDGVWVQTGGGNSVVFTPGATTVTDADSGTAAVLTKSWLPVSGERFKGNGSEAKVNGSKTAADTGPRPTGATVNGATLTVTYNRTLAAVTDTDTAVLQSYFSVHGAGIIGVSGNRNADQHPSAVAVSGVTVTLTLGDPARAGDTVMLTYKLNDHTGPLKDNSDKIAPAFVELAVTNNTPGAAGPAPLTASVTGTTLALVFDGALNESSAPAGSAFTVSASDRDYDTRSIAGTGTATVSGTEVAVQLAEAVRADELATVSYAKPASAPLQGAGGDAVLSFDHFKIETVYDGVAPKLLSLDALQTGTSPARSRIVLYFDEPLDPDSVPAAGDFSVQGAGAAQDVSTVAVEGTAVDLTLGSVVNKDQTVTVTYTEGTNPIRDLAGNAVATATASGAVGSAGTPELRTDSPYLPGVDGARLTLTFDKALDPAQVPGPGAFTLHYPLDGEPNRVAYPVDIDAVAVERARLVLHLALPVFPCDDVTPFTVSYTKPTGANAPKLQGLGGAQAPAFAHQNVTNARTGDCVRLGTRAVSPTVGSEVSAFPRSVTLQFQRPLDTTRALPVAAFGVAGASGMTALAVTDGAYTDDGSGVVLTLARALEDGEAVKVSYTRGAGEPGLWDTDGMQIADFSGVAVTAPEAPAVGAAPSLSVDDAHAAEGGTLSFAVRLDAASEAEVTVDYATADGTAAAGQDYTAASGTLAFAPGEREKTVEVAALADRSPERAEMLSFRLSNASGATIADGEAVGLVTNAAPGTEEAPGTAAALTASFDGVPAEHDGKRAFSFGLAFSEEVKLSFRMLKEGALLVENGRVTKARRAVKGENRRWTVTVKPDSFEDVTVVLPAAAVCGGPRSVCTHDGRRLSNAARARIIGPALLSVTDAEAREGIDPEAVFEVSLSRAASGTVTVDYATADGTAVAGEDFTATSGTLTFAAGEREKTVSVPILDDVIDEGPETFLFKLSNAQGARIVDGEATGTIENNDHMPKAWTARFGRTVAVHVVDAVEQRLEGGPSGSWAQFGGHSLGAPPPGDEELVSRFAPDRSLWEEADAIDVPGQEVTPRQLLLGTAFHLVSDAGQGTAGPRLSAWGRVASSGFDAREDKLSLNGTVTTASLGVDGIWKHWLTGLLLAYSEGDGSFTHVELPGGDVSSSLTSLHPYVAYTLNDRVRLWGLVGYGSGALALNLEDERAMHTDLTMTMGAVGVRGSLLRPSHPGGLELALRSDVLWMVMDSAAADNLAASEAEASRLRLVLEGSRPVALAGGGSFTPSLEVGLRHDGGDADTGTGVEVGGSLRYASAWGLSIEASLRALVAHEAQDYTEWGASGALRFDPGGEGRGFTASIAPAWGQAGSGVSRLWGQSTATGLMPADAMAHSAAGRLEAQLGYGLATLRGRGLLTPYARVALTEGADQAWHLGTRLALAQSLNFSLEASRRAREGDVAAHELALRANLGF